MQDVTMPKLSDSMEVGKVIAWNVKVGDSVSEGDVLAEVESDKAVMELECFADGVIAEILKGDDTEVAVGEVIARIAEEGEDAGEAAPPVEEPEPEPEPEPAPAPKPVAPATPQPVAPTGDRVRISPYARKLAEKKGVDYSTIKGTGPSGRIMARDIEGAQGVRKVVSAPKAEDVCITPAEEEVPALEVRPEEADVVDADFRMKTQARRLIEANHTIPQFHITRGVEVTSLLRRKAELKEKYGATLTHIIMRAICVALGKHPEVNRSYDRGKVIKWKGIHLGLAVDTDAGLTVVVLRNAQTLSILEIVEQTRTLVEKARAGKLTAEERRHPTFTITNLGMFDVEHFAPIINPPSSITLAIASALPSTVVEGESIRIGHVMRLTAACDHRIVDGATAARFMKTLSEALADVDALVK
jgi:pyruvate dehydrogenase E2 component (dihydrolipoyllysine-residue acetyltransferase)